MSFMSIPIISRGYRDGSLLQKDDGLGHNIHIVEGLDNKNSIHAFNRCEEEGHVERFQCHLRLVDLARGALCALGTRKIHN